ncbi:hypothetical protein [Roseibacillus persicicus]|uniref:Uncharacterized protein n=1 Tax=Roseibacillus persicicus TaxID=454148 RepID=A0A918TP02_9BACT|nr:hypothetical protein [Roseibacillus persicicus]GHC54680.1 hypothetical protein GCM10007100_21440 [Roseibacillus persicicus]
MKPSRPPAEKIVSAVHRWLTFLCWILPGAVLGVLYSVLYWNQSSYHVEARTTLLGAIAFWLLVLGGSGLFASLQVVSLRDGSEETKVRVLARETFSFCLWQIITAPISAIPFLVGANLLLGN